MKGKVSIGKISCFDFGLWFPIGQKEKTRLVRKTYPTFWLRNSEGYPGIMEIVSPHKKETYRAIYALKIGTRIYVLHAFQKKAKHGIKTPKPDLELIDARYKAAKRLEEDNV